MIFPNDLAGRAMVSQTRKVGDSDPTKATQHSGWGDNTLLYCRAISEVFYFLMNFFMTTAGGWTLDQDYLGLSRTV